MELMRNLVERISGIVADPSGAIVPRGTFAPQHKYERATRRYFHSRRRLPVRQFSVGIVRTHHDDERLQHFKNYADTWDDLAVGRSTETIEVSTQSPLLDFRRTSYRTWKCKAAFRSN